MKPSCTGISDLNPEFENLFKKYNDWVANPKIKEFIQDPDLVFGHIIQSEFKQLVRLKANGSNN